jgi:hypothetical protein
MHEDFVNRALVEYKPQADCLRLEKNTKCLSLFSLSDKLNNIANGFELFCLFF